MALPARVLVIQTAFIGDVILTTGLLETLLDAGYEVDLLVRAGNEGLFAGHPRLSRVLIWEKRRRKYWHWWQMLGEIRRGRYEYVINTHRYFATGLWTALSGAAHRYGFRQNPLSSFYTHRAHYATGDGSLEVERNLRLIEPLRLIGHEQPKLYPRPEDWQIAQAPQGPYVTVAPGSVWFTKRYPAEAWARLIAQIDAQIEVHLIGGPEDRDLCAKIADLSGRACVLRAGKLSLLASAALMAKAQMNYVNDSSPLHLASAMNAPVTAFFLSTAPVLGFGPMSTVAEIRETLTPLACRPCGPTGKKTCPLGHFKCSEIEARP